MLKRNCTSFTHYFVVKYTNSSHFELRLRIVFVSLKKHKWYDMIEIYYTIVEMLDIIYLLYYMIKNVCLQCVQYKVMDMLILLDIQRRLNGKKNACLFKIKRGLF